MILAARISLTAPAVSPAVSPGAVRPLRQGPHYCTIRYIAPSSRKVPMRMADESRANAEECQRMAETCSSSSSDKPLLVQMKMHWLSQCRQEPSSVFSEPFIAKAEGQS